LKSIPKKQLAKIQQQLTDMERKESEFKRSAASAAVKYQQACQELGIEVSDFFQYIPTHKMNFAWMQGSGDEL
jgi:hypothetical protein